MNLLKLFGPSRADQLEEALAMTVKTMLLSAIGNSLSRRTEMT